MGYRLAGHPDGARTFPDMSGLSRTYAATDIRQTDIINKCPGPSEDVRVWGLFTCPADDRHGSAGRNKKIGNREREPGGRGGVRSLQLCSGTAEGCEHHKRPLF